MVAAKYDNIKEISTRIILQILIMLQMEIQNGSTLSLSPMTEAKLQRKAKTRFSFDSDFVLPLLDSLQCTVNRAKWRTVQCTAVAVVAVNI